MARTADKYPARPARSQPRRQVRCVVARIEGRVCVDGERAWSATGSIGALRLRIHSAALAQSNVATCQGVL
jgi:hypothetical protein